MQFILKTSRNTLEAFNAKQKNQILQVIWMQLDNNYCLLQRGKILMTSDATSGFCVLPEVKTKRDNITFVCKILIVLHRHTFL